MLHPLDLPQRGTLLWSPVQAALAEHSEQRNLWCEHKLRYVSQKAFTYEFFLLLCLLLNLLFTAGFWNFPLWLC